jgi:pimeloyl-ACP methyl ester carboxylesterase
VNGVEFELVGDVEPRACRARRPAALAVADDRGGRNGIRLYYEEHGEGTPILGIHGSGSSSIVMWAGAVEPLSRLGRLILFDRRGCNRSERPEPFLRSTREEEADDAAALLDALDAAPAVVIGRSYGGDIALELARRHPARERPSG